MDRIEKWEDMTLTEYFKLKEISSGDDYIEDIEIKLVALLNRCSVEDILNMPLPQFRRLRADAQFISELPKIKNKCPKKITINNKKYYVTDNLSKVTTGQYIDFRTYLKLNDDKYIPNILACFIIPEGKLYGEGYNIDDVIEDLKENMGIVEALEISGFFQKAFLNLTKGTLLFLELKMKRELKKAKTEEEKEKMKEIVKNLHSIRNGIGYMQ